MREREKEKQTEREVEAASEGCGSSFTLVASERAQSEAQGPRLEPLAWVWAVGSHWLRVMDTLAEP